jgi:hypothetical protein
VRALGIGIIFFPPARGACKAKQVGVTDLKTLQIYRWTDTDIDADVDADIDEKIHYLGT